jgi:YegS/Rv2252/BmrU family lipid kinase
MARRALCLVNPKAKSGEAAAERLEQLLSAAGLQPRVLLSASPEEALAALQREAAQHDLVVLGGGDGTLSALAGAVLESGRPLGIVPLGTANDLARSLDIPTELELAVAVIAAGRSAPIDVGLIETAEGRRRFLNVASLGLAVEVARHHRGARKRLLGVLAYPLSWWDAWRARRPLRLVLTLDGATRRVRCLQLAIGCGRHYGGGMTVDEQASHFDGLLRLYYLRPVPLLALLWLLPALRFGRLKQHRQAVTWSGRRVEVAGRRPLPIDVDGDLALSTPARFSVEPAALQVFLPEEALRRAGAERKAGAP